TPLPGLAPNASVTDAVDVVTVLPLASSIPTCTAGLMTAVIAAFVGWTMNPTLVAAPKAATLNAELVALVKLPADAASVYPVPAALLDRSLNVASPADADRVTVPPSEPLPAFVPMAIVTDVLVLTTLPAASCTATTTDGAIVAFRIEALGCTVKASFVAGPIA